MFKANFIDNSEYYNLRSRLGLIGLIGSVISGIFPIFFESFPLWIYGMVILAYIFYAYHQLKLSRKLKMTRTGKKIEIDQKKLLISNQKKEVEEEIFIENVDSIKVSEAFKLWDQDTTDIVNNLKGKHHKNFIELSFGEKTRKYEFEIESHYMVVQINKLLKHWEKRGIEVLYW